MNEREREEARLRTLATAALERDAARGGAALAPGVPRSLASASGAWTYNPETFFIEASDGRDLAFLGLHDGSLTSIARTDRAGAFIAGASVAVGELARGLVNVLDQLDRIRAAAHALRNVDGVCPGEIIPSRVDALLAVVGPTQQAARWRMIASHHDIAPCHHAVHPDIMSGFVATFTKPIQITDSVGAMVGQIVAVEQRGGDLWGEVTGALDEIRAGKFVKINWTVGGMLSSAFLDAYPHSTSWDEDDVDDRGPERLTYSEWRAEALEEGGMPCLVLWPTN